MSRADRNSRGPAEEASHRLGFRQWLLILCLILLALFFVLNSQKVEVNVLVATVQMPLVIALGIAALLGLLAGWAIPRLRKGRSRVS